MEIATAHECFEARSAISKSSSCRNLFSGLLVVLLAGCRSEQLTQLHTDMRESLLALYEEQLMDNLVRVRLNKPIVHIDYGAMTAMLHQTVSSKLTSGGDHTANQFVQVPEGVSSALPPASNYSTKAVEKDSRGFELSGMQMTQLQLAGAPLISVDQVYKAYVSLGQDKSFLVCSFDMPPHDPPVPKTWAELEQKISLGTLKVHAIRRLSHPLPIGYPRLQNHQTFREDDYCYVPENRASEFFALFMISTVKRQVTVPKFDEQNIKGLVARIVKANNVHADFRITSAVPNSAASAIVTIAGVEYKFTVIPYTVDGNLPIATDIVRFEVPTGYAYLLNDPSKWKQVKLLDVTPGAVPNAISPVESTLKEIELQLQRLNFNNRP